MPDCDWCTEQSVFQTFGKEPTNLCGKHFNQQMRDREISNLNRYLEGGYPKPVQVPVNDGHGNFLFYFEYFPEESS
jgi:hypothetical protein